MRSGIDLFGCGLGRGVRWVLASLALVSGSAHAQQQLSERERTFLKIVFSGDEGKAVDYAQVAGINANSIGGKPLSAWFYNSSDSFLHRNLRVQKIVFEQFKQNANPPLQEIGAIRTYCSYAPYPQNFNIDANGTPAQREALAQQQYVAQKQHIDAMIAGFESLRHYGLTDRNILSAMLPNCVFSSPGPASEYIYDNLVTKLLAAGANIDTANPSGRQYGREGRAIEHAVSDENDAVVERLIRDGAQVKFSIPVACEDRSTNLYGYILERHKRLQRDRVVRIIGLLNAAGLPASKPVTAVAGVGFTYCRRTTAYDEALNAGNLDFAKAVKTAIETTKPLGRAAPAAAPTPQPVVSAAPAVAPSQIGGWQISTENGRLVAVAKADKKTSNGFAALRLECVGGKLEYAPVALKLNGPMTSLWISIAGDAKEMKLANQRASGQSATTLSNEFAANEPKAGQPPDWGIEMTVQSWNSAGDNVVMTGFSKMRAFMRANCKS